MIEQLFNFKVTYKVSFGGPRDDRYYDITFPHAMDFQFHLYKSYQKIALDNKSNVKSCTYVDLTTGAQLAFVSRQGIVIQCSIGPLFFNPETVGFDMLGINPLNNKSHETTEN